jgi:NAD(P)H-hydrate repair Nnr-like enzyme with NAD(P)H-hydrate epimerase domain
MVPEISFRHSAMRAIMARAESLTADGAMPSAQLMDESAVAFADAVSDHL